MSGATTPAGRRRAAARAAGAASAPRPRTAAPPRRPSPKRRAAPKRTARARPKLGVRTSRTRGGRFRRRAMIALVAAAALAIAYFAWFRDSSLVAVSHVNVTGLAGDDSGPATAALTKAAEGMTTLDVDQGRLDAVAAQYPEIASVSADASFPHSMALRVVERPPAMIARDGSRQVPVAADGTVLAGVNVPSGERLPTFPVSQLPAAGRLQGDALREARVLGAAPGALRGEISGVSFGSSRGVTVGLHGGIQVRFGSAAGASTKWAAAAAVLADRRLGTLAYVDVRVPKRPAVG